MHYIYCFFLINTKKLISFYQREREGGRERDMGGREGVSKTVK